MFFQIDYYFTCVSGADKPGQKVCSTMNAWKFERITGKKVIALLEDLEFGQRLYDSDKQLQLIGEDTKDKTEDELNDYIADSIAFLLFVFIETSTTESSSDRKIVASTKLSSFFGPFFYTLLSLKTTPANATSKFRQFNAALVSGQKLPERQEEIISLFLDNYIKPKRPIEDKKLKKLWQRMIADVEKFILLRSQTDAVSINESFGLFVSIKNRIDALMEKIVYDYAPKFGTQQTELVRLIEEFTASLQ